MIMRKGEQWLPFFVSQKKYAIIDYQITYNCGVVI
jgi:hypothetical protein